MDLLDILQRPVHQAQYVGPAGNVQDRFLYTMISTDAQKVLTSNSPPVMMSKRPCWRRLVLRSLGPMLDGG